LPIFSILLGWLSQRYDDVADWTHGNRASLSAASQRVVAALDTDPIVFTAFVAPGSQRHHIRMQLSRYARAANNVQLDFVDPALHPEQIRNLDIQHAGAVRVSYQGRAQMLDDLHEATVTTALQRLSGGGEQWLIFVSGHGEHSLADSGPGGYSQLAAALDAQGLKTRELNLAR